MRPRATASGGDLAPEWQRLATVVVDVIVDLDGDGDGDVAVIASAAELGEHRHDPLEQSAGAPVRGGVDDLSTDIASSTAAHSIAEPRAIA